ncbi:MAG TPA: DHA2 family efflux MFS transporter permease subunit [Chthoniobacteraceae bacterium]|jgi:DHA2 family multidrug resistance protein|nr:DHA2 family efflux MFS transporter permease subunit [Chthoniobacteraceae bacterium]
MSLAAMQFDSPLAQRAAAQGWIKWAIAITVALGAILEVIDVSIVNVALPHMQGNLGATLSEIGWVITGYSMANVVIIPLTAWLDDRFGRKPYFIFSLVAFVAASVLCGLATSLPMLIFARVLQGLGGGSMLGKAQSILFQTFSKEEQGAAQAAFGLAVIMGPAIGPTLGGYLTDALNWRWIFFINIPIGIVAVLLAVTFMPRDEPRAASAVGKPVDWLGIFLMTAGLASLQVILEEGQQEDWFASRFISTAAGICVAALAAFVWWERRVAHPAVDLRVLRYRSVAAGSSYSILLGAGLYGALFAIPIFAQNYLHFTAQQTGELMIPSALASGVAMVVAGKLVGKCGPLVLIAAGSVITAGVMFSLATLNPDTGAGDLFWPLVFRGLGSAAMFVPLSIATLGSVPKRDIPAASGFYNLTRQLGGSIGIAILTTLLARREAVHRAVLVERISPLSHSAMERFHGLMAHFQNIGASVHEAQQRAVAALDMIVNGQAALRAFDDLFTYVGITFIVTLPLILLLGRGGKTAPAEVH